MANPDLRITNITIALYLSLEKAIRNQHYVHGSPGRSGEQAFPAEGSLKWNRRAPTWYTRFNCHPRAGRGFLTGE